MENFILIAIGILVVFLILRFIFKALKAFFYVVIILVLGVVGLHYFNPQTIDGFIEKINSAVKDTPASVKTKLDTITK